MGAKGLWRHVEGVAVIPRQYSQVSGVYVLADIKTPASEEQVEAQERKIETYKKKRYLTQHNILSTTSLVSAQRLKI